MAGLPKKYAKMGFKKGWAAYKRSGSRRKSTGSTSRRKASPRRRTRRVVNVARKRKGYYRRKAKGILTGTPGKAVASFGYGIFRNKLAGAAQRFLPGVAGQYGDNVVMAAAGVAATLWGKGMLRQAGKQVVYSEAFLAGIKTGSRIGNSGGTSGALF